MGALPSQARGSGIPKRRGGLAAGRLPGWGRRGLASGMGSVATVIPLWMPYKHPPGRRAQWVWVGYTLIAALETEACAHLFQLRGLGYPRSFLRGAVSAMHALEEMGWLPELITGRVWRCAKWSTSQAVACPYAGLEELRDFGRVRWQGTVDCIRNCSPIVHLPATGGRGSHQAWRIAQPGTGVSHRQV